MFDNNNHSFVLLDGAMGTMLQKSGLKLGERPEILNITHPEVIQGIHQAYLTAGSQIIYSNTFGANAHKLSGTGYSVKELIQSGVSIAKQAVLSSSAKVALDIGPIGEMLEPSGVLQFETAYDIFKEMMVYGAQSGADLIVLETMTDLYEVKAAILAAKENTDLPVFVTMTFEANGRTFSGCCPESFVAVAEGLGIQALGINCSLGPSEILPIAKKISQLTNLPLIVKANAGLPNLNSHEYDISAGQYAKQIEQIADLGVRYIGGCCGTTPEYIKAIHDYLKNKQCPLRAVEKSAMVCTPSNSVLINDVRIIGERINPTGKKRFKKALLEGDMDYILSQGVEQADAGADILDVNVGLPDINEPEVMKKTVKAIQSIIDLPLQIDSSDPRAIEAGLRACNGKPIVNSVNGESNSLDRILPLVKKYGAAVVGLTLDERGIPATSVERFAIAKKIMSKALDYGIPKEDIYIDCLTLTVSAEQKSAQETLKTMRLIKEQLGLKTVLGVSNISFGLPNRELINQTFLIMAMSAGLDLPIINPNVKSMMDAVRAYRVLANLDKDSEDYIGSYTNVIDENKTPVITQNKTIEYAIGKGLPDEVRQITKQLLAQKSELEIIDYLLIPALDQVGERYEKGEIFLPQLIKSATAAQVAFELIKEKIAQEGSHSISKGKIILATVKGDIHDIGKNIVKTILENYGYQILDLGRDVPIEQVVKVALEEDVKLIGLSALMTTTLKSMADTISALRQSGHSCKIMVGGAVLTEDYALKIGADYYSKDAKDGVAIAQTVFQEV